jgi:hypothetical protein
VDIGVLFSLRTVDMYEERRVEKGNGGNDENASTRIVESKEGRKERVKKLTY